MKSFIVLLLLGVYSSFCLSVELHALDAKQENIARYVLKYENDNLRQSALLLVGSPSKLASNTIITMAHGFHPNPPQYGKVEGGVSSRPGDYYREWVNAYAKAGFNVLVPDYRGHNDSAGLSFTHQEGQVEFPEQFYALDLIAAVDALQEHLQTKFEKIVLVGHSMGSPIAFYAANQIGPQVKLVSLWSSAAYRFPPVKVPPKYLLQHGKYDAVTSSDNLAYYRQHHDEQLIEMFLYETKLHMLAADDFKQAISTDIRLIREIFNEN
jgi:pimeloyl-ACP methyl ester carboxylesterase